MVLSLFREAIPAGQVTVMSDMEAQRLYHRLPLFEIIDIILIHIRGKQLSCRFQLQYLFHGFSQYLCRVLKLLSAGQILHEGFCTLHTAGRQLLNQRNNIIYHIIHYMNGTAVYIQDYVVPIAFILMYHLNVPF